MDILHMFGKLDEVKPVEHKNKNTGKIEYSTQLTVEFIAYDEKGYKVKSVENIQVDEDEFDRFDAHIDKYIMVTHKIINAKSGTFIFPDVDMPILTFDKNPLDYSAFKRPARSPKDTAK
jgi:hypothetical protein